MKYIKRILPRLLLILGTLTIGACGGDIDTYGSRQDLLADAVNLTGWGSMNENRPSVARTINIRPLGSVIFPITIGTKNLVRYCADHQDSYITSLQLTNANDEVIWSHQGLENCPASVNIPAGNYVLTINYNIQNRTKKHYDIPIFIQKISGSTTDFLDILVSTRSCIHCDLSHLSLAGLDMSKSDLRGVNLRGANIKFSTFVDSLLSKADLTGVELSHRDWSGVDLSDAILHKTTGWAISFQGAILRRADFSQSNLENTNFGSTENKKTDLNSTNFEGANLKESSFSYSDLGCTNLRSADLRKVSFEGTSLQCVNMSEARLEGSYFDAIVKMPGKERKLPATNLSECQADGVAESKPQATGLFDAMPCGGILMAGASISINSPPPSSWRYLDLNNAVFSSGSGALTGYDLSSIDLSDGRLQGFDFSGSVLSNATFDRANLRGANFKGANLVGARLSRAELPCLSIVGQPDRCVSFVQANMRGALLTYANASGADFSGAVMSGNPTAPIDQPESRAANLSYLYGPNTRFINTDLTAVNFSNAQVYGATTSFKGGSLARANFSGATLSKVDFSEAQLQGTKFINANLVGANFSNASFGQLTVSGEITSFNGAYLQGAIFDLVQAYWTDFSGATLAQAAGTIQIEREVSPGQLGVVFEGFMETRLPAATDHSTICPIGESGACQASQWITGNPKKPKCIPTPTQWCPRDATP